MNNKAESLVEKIQNLNMRAGTIGLAVSLLLTQSWNGSRAQEPVPVAIRVDAAQKIAPFKPIYAYFGYDEANYTYTRNGSELLGELAGLTGAPVYIRTHFLLTTGDGTPGLKWGSTNAYTEDISGKAVYDWTIADRIFDTYLKAHTKPFVEIGFMPEALSAKPKPYRPTWVPGAANKDYAIGWSYPPKDYSKWGELVYQWTRHCAEKYGEAEAESWYWEVWNEPELRCFISTTARIRSALGPFGPGLALRFAENRSRYFR